MFDKYFPTQHQYTSVPTTVNHKYENCPTTETAKFLKELQDEAQKSVFNVMKVKDSIIECEVAYSNEQLEEVFYVKLKINGKEHLRKFSINRFMDRDQRLNFATKSLRETIVDCIMEEPLHNLMIKLYSSRL